MGIDTEVAELIIRDVYSMEATRDGEWVSLATIRDRAAIDRSIFDRTIKMMDRAKGVNVVPEGDQKTLTSEDRAAAVVFGGTPCHKIQIEW